MKSKKRHICDSRCMYYPLYPYKVLKDYINKDGVHCRSCVFLCRFDSHRIKKYDICENYKVLRE